MTKGRKKVLSLTVQSGVIPYALRQSSIVRGLRRQLPVRLVAALDDTSLEMIERRYSRWIVEGLDPLGEVVDASTTEVVEGGDDRQTIGSPKAVARMSDLAGDRAA